ncbi:MAG: class I SAM-dependent methyltransferase [Patescibacteria group bacterium]|nr:class I SAM-dependent methyltransferase [Patescibacteria group bacterium]
MEYKIKKDWWKSQGGYFNNIYLEGDNSSEGFLNSPLDLDNRTKKESEGVQRLCCLNKGDKILDCPSGYGRHSLTLAAMGFDVVGADINEQFLAVANKGLQKAKLPNIRFIKKDMRELDFKNEFNAVINMFYSFGFFEDETDNVKALKNFYAVLKPGGKFLMHTHVTVPKFMKGLIKTHEIRTLKTEKKLELFRQYNKAIKREEGQWFLLDGKIKKEASAPYSMRIYTDKEFQTLCKNVGFTKVKIYGDWDGTEYKDKSELMIVVATK